MRIDNKYFNKFMAVMAAITAVILVYASFSFKNNSDRRFFRNIAENEELPALPMNLLQREGTLTLESMRDSEVVVVFFSSWSGKSRQMLEELVLVQEQFPSLRIVGALVNDVLEDINFDELPADFTYVDGVRLFNELKVPGVPSYILFGKNNEYRYADVGFRKGVATKVLAGYLNE